MMKNISFFQGIESEDLKNLLQCLNARTIECKKGQILFREGDLADEVGLVLNGGVQIIRDDYYGNRSIMATIGPGNLFEETFACMNMEELPVGVYAFTDSKIMLIDCKRILNTCSNACAFHNMLIHNLVRNMAQKNLLLSQKIEFTSQKTTKEKLMSYLLAQAKTQGSDTFEIALDRQALADYLGVERSAMSAEMGRLRDEGYILVDRKNI